MHNVRHSLAIGFASIFELFLLNFFRVLLNTQESNSLENTPCVIPSCACCYSFNVSVSLGVYLLLRLAQSSLGDAEVWWRSGARSCTFDLVINFRIIVASNLDKIEIVNQHLTHNSPTETATERFPLLVIMQTWRKALHCITCLRSHSLLNSHYSSKYSVDTYQKIVLHLVTWVLSWSTLIPLE